MEGEGSGGGGAGGDNHLGHLQSSCISKLKMGEIAQAQSGRLISFSGEVGGGKKKLKGTRRERAGISGVKGLFDEVVSVALLCPCCSEAI